jgi:flagellar biosynthesis protein FlhG
MSESRVSNWLLANNQYTKAGLSAATSRAVTINFTGGKGGVGKTTLALKLALELTSMKFRVLYIDCDYNLSNSAIKLGLNINESFTDYIEGKIPFSRVVRNYRGMTLLPACNGSLDIHSSNQRFEDYIISILSSQEMNFDYIILDSSAGIQKDSASLSAYCDHRVVVVTPDRSSITDSYSVMKILNKVHGVKEFSLLINRVKSERQFQSVSKSLADTVDSFLKARLKILGYFPDFKFELDDFDRQIFQQENNSTKYFFNKIARRIVDETGAQSVPVNAGLIEKPQPGSKWSLSKQESFNRFQTF